jgi:adenylate cyclase
VIGDVGSEHSLSFTVIGDTVNTASRLQSLTRSLATSIVVGDPLVEAVKQASPGTAAELLGSLEDIGEQNLRGRNAAIRAWIRRAATNGS